METGVLLAIRACQGVLALGTLGIVAVVADWYIGKSPFASPGSVNFLIFVPIFSIISVAYLEAVPRLAPRASHPFASLALELLNTVFYFAGFIAMAAFISRLEFCRGAVCAAAQASTVVAAASFVAWAGTTGLMTKNLFKGRLRGSRKDMVEAPGSGAVAGA